MFGIFLELISKGLLFFALHIQKGNSFPPSLSSKEENELLTEFKNGNNEAKNKLVEHNLRLVAHIVKKFENKTNDADDLISIGTIGLIKGIDSYNEYDFYKERINSQKEFQWNEYNTQDNELNDELFEEIDVIVLLYGLYHQNKEICDELIDKSQEYEIPLLFVRSFGVEYVVEEIVEKADAVVGWNPHCIIDAIQTLVTGEEEWIKPCDIEEES